MEEKNTINISARLTELHSLKGKFSNNSLELALEIQMRIIVLFQRGIPGPLFPLWVYLPPPPFFFLPPFGKMIINAVQFRHPYCFIQIGGGKKISLLLCCMGNNFKHVRPSKTWLVPSYIYRYGSANVFITTEWGHHLVLSSNLKVNAHNFVRQCTTHIYNANMPEIICFTYPWTGKWEATMLIKLGFRKIVFRKGWNIKGENKTKNRLI